MRNCRINNDYLRGRFASPLAGLVPLEEPPGASASVEELDQFVRAHPGDLVGRLRLGAAHFRERRWDEASRVFGVIVEQYPDDAPVQIMLQRCRQYQQAPPAEGWDGVYLLTEK